MRGRTAALLIVLGSAVRAQAAEPGAPRVERFELDSGLRVVVSPVPDAPLSVCLSVAAGSKVEQPNEAGFAWALARLQPIEQRRAADVQGVSWTSDSGREFVRYCATTPRETWGATLRALAHWFKNGPSAPAALPTEADPLSERRAQARVAGLVLQGNWALSHDPTTPAAFALAPDFKRLQDFRVRWHVPALAVVSAAGALPPSAQNDIRRAFSTVPKRAPAALAPIPLPRQSSERFLTLRAPERDIGAIHYGWAGPGAQSADYPVIQLIAAALAAEPNGALRSTLLKTRQVARTVEARVEPGTDVSLFTLKLDVTRGVNPDNVHRPFIEIIRRIRLLGLYPREIEQARLALRETVDAQLRDSLRAAMLLGESELLWRDARRVLEQLQAAEAITPDRTRSVAAQYLGEQRLSIVELHPKFYVDMTTPAPASKRPANRSHVVRRGDTLGAIARRYGVTLEALQKANGLSKRSIISPGQKLVVPPATQK